MRRVRENMNCYGYKWPSSAGNSVIDGCGLEGTTLAGDSDRVRYTQHTSGGMRKNASSKIQPIPKYSVFVLAGPQRHSRSSKTVALHVPLAHSLGVWKQKEGNHSGFSDCGLLECLPSTGKATHSHGHGGAVYR